MNRERLQRLAELLDNVNPRLFDMDHWARHVGRDGTDFHDSDKIECRTAACAVGWAASDPWFREQGLTLKKGFHSHDHDGYYWSPAFADFLNAGAVEAFFDLEYDEANHLFIGSEYNKNEVVTPAIVAARIREFISAQ